MTSGPVDPKPLTLSPEGKAKDVLGKTLFEELVKSAKTQETKNMRRELASLKETLVVLLRKMKLPVIVVLARKLVLVL